VKILISLSVVVLSWFPAITASAETSVGGYVRKDGTYVPPYTRSSPNSTNRDNFSTQGNRNPYTGSAGSRAPDYSSRSYNYGSGRAVNTGPRGGQYYYNNKGNKTYVPKR
jgi:hypothetical protein